MRSLRERPAKISDRIRAKFYLSVGHPQFGTKLHIVVVLHDEYAHAYCLGGAWLLVAPWRGNVLARGIGVFKTARIAGCWLAAVTWVAGCGAAVPEANDSAVCAAAITAPPDGLRRLTMTQYANTMRDLVRWALGEGPDAESVIAQAALDALPSDRREPLPQDPHGSYRRLDQSLEQVHVDESFRVAAAIAAGLTEPQRLERVVGACAVDDDPHNERACLLDFLERFGSQVLRRPLDPDDIEFYGSAATYSDLIHVLLSSTLR